MLRAPWFHTGLYWGAAATIIAVIGGIAFRARTGRPAPVAAILAAGAAAMAFQLIGPRSHWSISVAISLAALVAGAGLAVVLGFSNWLWLPTLVPGAALLAYWSGLEGPAWVSHLVFLTVVAGSVLVIEFDRRDSRAALGPAMALFSVGGVFLCIPDTNQALVMLGSLSPIALTGWPLRLTRLGAVGVPVWIGVYAWAVAVGGIARLGPILAAICCLGLLALEPVAHSVFVKSNLARGETGPRQVWERPTSLLLSTHLLFVLVASRLAGVRSPLERTILVLVVSMVTATVLLVRKLPGRENAIDVQAESDAGPSTSGGGH